MIAGHRNRDAVISSKRIGDGYRRGSDYYSPELVICQVTDDKV